ncbi:unnamed protein product [Acanthosepion pharaonis]|uniref:Uncharacterized protein n=1 Tax=Acanthosepion pharaonis TaxID=158019 RepID=A0A812E131_ACAPH|nr:unnamed protein product [Sepia pharaonis]
MPPRSGFQEDDFRLRLYFIIARPPSYATGSSHFGKKSFCEPLRALRLVFGIATLIAAKAAAARLQPDRRCRRSVPRCEGLEVATRAQTSSPEGDHRNDVRAGLMGGCRPSETQAKPNRVWATFGSTGLSPPRSSERSPFTPGRFHVLLNSLCKVLSTFPHGTCRLSDSSRYLAGGWAYDTIWAACRSGDSQIVETDARRPHRNGPGTCRGRPDRGTPNYADENDAAPAMKRLARSLYGKDSRRTRYYPVHSPGKVLVEFLFLRTVHMLKFRRVVSRHAGGSGVFDS